MRIARALLLPLIAALILAGAWQYCGDRALPLLLKRFGLHDVHVGQTTLTADSLHISRFTATLAQDAGPVRIDLDNVLCRYRFFDLIKGNAASLSMDRAEITLPPSPATDKETGPPDIAGALKRVAKASLHLDHLQVRKLVVHPTTAESHQHPAVAVSMATTDMGKALSLSLADANPDTPAPLTAQLELNQDQLNGTLKAEASLLKLFRAETDPGALPSRGRITAQWSLNWLQTDEQSLHLLLNLSNIQGQQLQAKAIQLQVDGTWLPALQVLQLGPSSHLVVNKAQKDDLTVAAVELNLAGQVRLKPDGWQVEIKPASSWTTKGLVLNSKPLNPLHLNVLQATAERTGDTTKAHCRFHPPQGTGILQANFEYVPGNQGSGTATLKTVGPLVMSASSNLLLLLPSTYTTPFTLTSGDVKLDLQLRWSGHNNRDLRGSFSLDKGEGMMGPSPLTGMTVRQTLRFVPGLESLEPGVVEIERLGGPVALEHLRLTTAVRRSQSGPLPSIVLARASGKLFGGRITANQCVYDLNQPVHSCRLHIANVEVAQIIALQNAKGLEASGTVEGQLPLELSPKGISINGGELHSMNEGGIIRYQPPGDTFAHSELTASALKALEEFRYQQLSVQIGYQPDGTLTAGLRLVGHSPRLDATRPVHLNIQTEQNLLSLLKSIRYSQGLTSELEQEMQQRIPQRRPD